MRRASVGGLEPTCSEEGVNSRIEGFQAGMTNQKFAYEILGVFVEAFRKRIIQGLDLLPREVLGQSLEGESARDHLEDDAAKRP